MSQQLDYAWPDGSGGPPGEPVGIETPGSEQRRPGSRIKRLIAWIESHDGIVVEHFTHDAIWVRSEFTLVDHAGVFEVTERIEPSLEAARELLGY